jgi:hypothetical protein
MISTGMQQRAGLLFLGKYTGRIFLILEDSKWTVPTFPRNGPLLIDAEHLLNSYSQGRILPIELYLSEDKGFEYGTYVCVVKDEFFGNVDQTVCWSTLNNLPKNLHTGLKTTLNNQLIRAKLDTIMVLENDET